jgi:trans-aconitate methyltransferase
MNWMQDLENVDVYLIDQLLKRRIDASDRILDAGCGKGRNLRPFIDNDFDFIGFDPDPERISTLIEAYPEVQDSFVVSSIESFKPKQKFNFIICNAVLHFAQDETQFDHQFEKLISFLEENGILFIRMTTTIGLPLNKTGTYQLPDETERFLITRTKIDELLNQYKLELLDPVKSTLVEQLRSMSTIVMQKTV